MEQKDLSHVIDEWTAAVGDLARRAPPAARRRLTRATGDLLEAFASTSTNLAAHVVSVLQKKLEATDRRYDRSGERLDTMQIHMDIQDQRIDDLEEHERERAAGHGSQN